MRVTDEWGNEIGWCNACGEEAPIDTECCEEGEVVEYDEEPDGAPCCPDPGCERDENGRCTFPGYADNH